MVSFMEDLWSSIFTPGPTPTLLIATNVTFAALQLVFFALLLATYSLHFVALSIISAGLWWSINWFAAEVRLAQLAQEAEQKKEKEQEDDPRVRGVSVGSDTETEVLASKKDNKREAVTTGSAAKLQTAELDSRKRPSTGGDGSGYGSTDSEWEKVDDSRS
ncbi:uncharacterized protein N7511_005491 [Penicillium nucicola]|uniref:uncharacterized protein n=1 Tax=Penicillium nucicola TaxID=1850975 RepID=UPI0025451A55|nr:uncharacterized protein N7511_005491 [Penicillium nucicola]KAJ5762109.1 hypothetical protein N7511_005491 [Penicillium nucicola]